jgi:hypothetical protein
MNVERCRQLAPEMTKCLTDEEVAALISQYEAFAEITVDVYLRNIPNLPTQNDDYPQHFSINLSL